MHEEETVDLLAYARRVARHLLPAAVLGLLVMVAVAALGFVQKPTYHTKAHVLVQPAQLPARDQASIEAEMLSRTMRTYVALDDLPVLVEAAAARTNGRFTPEQVASMTEIYWGGGSMLLAIRADASTLDDAKLLSNAMAEALVEHGPGLLNKQKETVPVMSVVEQAKIDEDAPAAASRTSMLPIALAAGVLVTALGAVVLEWLASRRRRAAAELVAPPAAGPDAGAPSPRA